MCMYIYVSHLDVVLGVQALNETRQTVKEAISCSSLQYRQGAREETEGSGDAAAAAVTQPDPTRPNPTQSVPTGRSV